jgi:hypothetical protein
MSVSRSLHPKLWGGATWRALTGIAYGLAENNGEEPLSEQTVLVLSALGGVLPCTACRGSYYRMVVEVLEAPGGEDRAGDAVTGVVPGAVKGNGSSEREKAEALLSKLCRADMPRFVHALHDRVDDKLDNAHFSPLVDELAVRLGMPGSQLAGVLRSARFCRGRRPRVEDMDAVHQLHTFKCTPEDVMSMLFMFAYAFPTGATHTRLYEDEARLGAAAPRAAAEEVAPGGHDAQRRLDFYTFMGNVADVMIDAGCDSAFQETLWMTWGAFEEGGWRESDTLYRDAHIDRVMQNVLKAKRERALTREDVFMLAWVVRARISKGFKSGRLEDALRDAKALYARIHASATTAV